MSTQEALAAAQELVARLTIMDTAQALPGDGAVAWREHRDECMATVADLAYGFVTMAVPE